jgi:hypothetical protein
MNYQRLASVLAPIFLLGSLLLIALAILEYVANLSGYTLMQQEHSPGRLLELSAALAVVAIALYQALMAHGKT